MTRAALTLGLLAVLALACERQESDAPRTAEGDGSVQTTEPELNNAQLEDELDRLEREIKNGKRGPDAATGEEPSREPAKAAPGAEPAPKPHRNKSKNSSNKAQEKRIHSPGNGSS